MQSVYRWLRRAWQVVFLGLFLFLVFVATPRWIAGYPVDWFLASDPLLAVASALAAHSITLHLAWAIPVLVLTILLGRFYCSWVCPMGVLHHALGWMARRRKPKDRVEQYRYRRDQRFKYWILAVLLGMAALGSTQVGLLDPIALTWRGLAVLAVPAADNLIFGLYQGVRHFQGAILVGVVFVGALALNAVRPRFFCRVLCPLGALLGLLARFSIFRIRREPDRCKDCNVCGAACQGGADPFGEHRVSECTVCLNCVHVCPRAGIRYGLAPGAPTPALDPGRRQLVAGAAAGLIAVPLLRVSDGVEPRPDPGRIRPPGALAEREFLERCVKCGACMKVCPTGGLQPALAQAGLEGLWSPVLVPRLGYCEQSCILCGHACPTGAIRPLTLVDRIGRPPDVEPIRIGSAAFDKGRCLPWAYDRECIVCEEVCPTSPKAIYVKLETVTLRDGSQKALKRPYVDLERCVGCGVCEARCPVFDRAAIRVTSVGETRSTENRIILTGGRL